MNALLLIAMRPASAADADRLSSGLETLMREDPTISVREGAAGEVVIGGMGELQMEIILDRLRNEFDVEAKAGRLHVAYLETITAPASGEMKHAKRIAPNSGEYAHVKLRVERGPSGSGCVFENATTGGTIPPEFMAAVEHGTKDAIANGIVAGYPIVDVHVVVYDGSYHDVDSSEAAFRLAAAAALRDAAKKAGPTVLEPVMRVDVGVPPDVGDQVMTNLAQRGGMIEAATIVDGQYRATVLVPLAGMFGYATDLRDRTEGRGNFRMVLAYYQPCGPPGSIDDDRITPVGAPLKPFTPPRRSSIALPEE
jgi:elongation factor G